MSNQKINVLRDELVLVANVVGDHELVAEEQGISTTYLRQIRQGKNAKLDTKENRELLDNLITIYRRIGKEKIEELKEAVK
ncbi:hypothetical protein [Tenacibaculum sp. 190524A05c]|uniref:hypothetical protein n=1 Tax=Tenacibaculum platacis TaxID=3137852 RepID=UPI0032B2980A